MDEKLVWNEERKFGYYPVQGNPYNEDYFEKYVGYSETPMGVRLTQARMDLVERFIGNGPVVDIGIGCGQFITARRFPFMTRGYDVNPAAIRWLLDRGLWADPYFQDPENATCFDSLEHMSRPDQFIERVKGHLFVSIPIFRDREHVLSSKHFRTDEHYYYFTSDGLILYFHRLGFDLLEENRMEVALGREGIGTFVFKRRP